MHANVVRSLLLLCLFVVVSPSHAVVYSVDANIDVDRMAVHKMYYDLYYNPVTKLFERSDLMPLSPTAIALIHGAREAKVDRAEGANEADRAEYTKQTGENKCVGDPYIGSGTDVVPEVQSPTKPNCLTGGATYADDDMGYVYLVDKAIKTTNAKSATLESFRADSFTNPVPRAASAPSADRTRYMDQWIVHDDGNLQWDGVPGKGVPRGLGLPAGCQKKDGSPCFLYLKDNSVPSYVDFAMWTDHAWVAGPNISADLNRLQVLKAELAVYMQPGQDVTYRHYSFLINRYTVTKHNVMFCDAGWKSRIESLVSSYIGDHIANAHCGGSYSCDTNPVQDCIDWDKSQKPPVCKTTTYHCRIESVCTHDDYSCGNLQTGQITVQNGEPLTVNITLDGKDPSLEPENLSNNIALVRAEAESRLPDFVKVGNPPISIKDIVRCDGMPAAYSSCQP